MAFTLERLIYGAAEPAGEMTILAISDHLTPQDAALWRGITSLKPMDAPTFHESRAFGLFGGPEDHFVFACAYNDGGQPFYEYILLPRRLLSDLAGSLAALLALFEQPSNKSAHTARISPIKLSSADSWTPQRRRALVEALLKQNNMDMTRVLRLLGAALHERGLMIYDYPADTEARLAVVRGLTAMLPARARPDLTFSTNRHEKTMTQARVVFAPSSVQTMRWIVDWKTQAFPDDDVLANPYIQRLSALWNGDLGAFLAAIDQMDSIAASAITQKNLQNRLTIMAERHALDAQIQAGEKVAPDALKAMMKDIPPEGELKRLYARRLLEQALETRDAEAAQIVARSMDDDPELDTMLYGALQRDLITQPDAVYSFMRARLNADPHGENSDRWGERLKIAALESLRVAITDGDAETAINWLRLVAREPASYDLGDIVHNSILAARERARSEPELAQALILLAVKRDPAALETLLADDALLASVPNGLGKALRDAEGDPTALLQSYGVEVFLMALSRALTVKRPDLFTPAAVAQVWAISNGGANGARESARGLIKELTAGGVTWLSGEALETLLTLMLGDKRDDLSHQAIHQISKRGDFLPVLISAIGQSERSDSDALALIAQLVAAGDLTQQGAVDVEIGLLAEWDWRESALEIMEQLARTIQQHHEIEVRIEVIWHMLAIASEMKEEFVARVALRRLTADWETVEDEGLIADDLQRVMPLIAWSSAAKAQLLTWWRSFTREQSTARLQRIDKALADNSAEAKRTLDDLRTIVQTVLAFRRMLGKRSLSQFAEDVSIAYAILQGLAESYDPSPKRAVNIDLNTIRQEMDGRSEELSPHELKILANNFKELAQLIASMAENRSKATLMRRGDDVDRQLMTGDQQPHGAVDTLKWMSGYLSGTQEKPDEEAE